MSSAAADAATLFRDVRQQGRCYESCRFGAQPSRPEASYRLCLTRKKKATGAITARQVQTELENMDAEEKRWQASFDRAESLHHQHSGRKVASVADAAQQANLEWTQLASAACPALPWDRPRARRFLACSDTTVQEKDTDSHTQGQLERQTRGKLLFHPVKRRVQDAGGGRFEKKYGYHAFHSVHDHEEPTSKGTRGQGKKIKTRPQKANASLPPKKINYP